VMQCVGVSQRLRYDLHVCALGMHGPSPRTSYLYVLASYLDPFTGLS
jgi:hypothetical protein